MCLPLLAAAPAVFAAGGAFAAAPLAAGATAGVAAATAAGGGLSLAGLAAGASLLSGAVGAFGAYQQGQQTSAMNKYQSQVLQQQSMLAQRAADANTTIVQNQGAEQSKALARKTAILAGAQAASEAANGTAGSVTSNDIKLDTFDTAKLDQMAIQYNTNLKTWGIQEGLHGEQWQLGVESDQYRKAARNASTTGYINAGTSILGSASQIANNRLMANYYANRVV